MHLVHPNCCHVTAICRVRIQSGLSEYTDDEGSRHMHTWIMYTSYKTYMFHVFHFNLVSLLPHSCPRYLLVGTIQILVIFTYCCMYDGGVAHLVVLFKKFSYMCILALSPCSEDVVVFLLNVTTKITTVDPNKLSCMLMCDSESKGCLHMWIYTRLNPMIWEWCSSWDPPW